MVNTNAPTTEASTTDDNSVLLGYSPLVGINDLPTRTTSSSTSAFLVGVAIRVDQLQALVYEQMVSEDDRRCDMIALMNEVHQILEILQSIVGESMQPAAPHPRPPPKRKIVELDSNVRQDINNTGKSLVERLGLILSAEIEIKKQVSQGKALVDPLKSWAYRAGRVAECVRQCHGGNVARFAKETTNFRFGKWGCAYKKKHSPCFDRSKLGIQMTSADQNLESGQHPLKE